ncbi:MAG: GNAT family N-acetyltransferase [Lachnospiraceae bacterium]|nr:GNAT family N-acetyltransferase [Lachnospiraceae bacterium]
MDCVEGGKKNEAYYAGCYYGYLFKLIWMAGKTCYVSSLYVKEVACGKGYGKMLLEYVIVLVNDRACKTVILDSGMCRTGAHKFYEENGFEKTVMGLRKYCRQQAGHREEKQVVLPCICLFDMKFV